MKQIMHTNLSSGPYYYTRTDDLRTLTQDLGSDSLLSSSHTYCWMPNTPRELKVCNPRFQSEMDFSYV